MSSKGTEDRKNQDEEEKKLHETRNVAADKEFLLEVCCYRICSRIECDRVVPNPGQNWRNQIKNRPSDKGVLSIVFQGRKEWVFLHRRRS